ncbi:MAG: META domain-containing protein [Muribaculaceae bacterium]
MKYSLISAIVAMAACTCSCSIFSNAEKIRGDQGSTSQTTPAAGPSTTPEQPATPEQAFAPVQPTERPAEQPQQQPAEEPATEQQPVEEEQSQLPSPADLPDTEIAREIAGEWVIISVGDTTIDRDEDMPYIIFEPSTGMFYAYNGCNNLSGSFSLTDNDQLILGPGPSTMKYCGDVQFDHEINVVLGTEGIRLKISHNGPETFLDVCHNNQSIMRLRRGDLSFLNGNWAVEAINGLDQLEVEATLFIDIDQHRIHGNTGCNYFNGVIYLDHRIGNAVDFSNLGITRMACPHAAQESAMLVALEQAYTAMPQGHDRVVILDDQGIAQLTLSRLPLDGLDSEE